MTIQPSTFPDRHTGPVSECNAAGIGDRYSPDSLLAGLESDPGDIAGIHLYSFNSLDPVPGGPDQAPPSSALETAWIRGAAREN